MSRRPLAFIDTETTSLPTGPCEPWEVALILRRFGEDGTTAEPDAAYLWQLPVERLERADPMSLQVGRWNERRLPQLASVNDWEDQGTGADRQARAYALVGHTQSGAPLPTHQVHPDDMRTWAANFVALTWGAVVVGICPSFDTNHALGPLLRRWGQVAAWHYQPTDAEDVAAGAIARLHDTHGTAEQNGPSGPPWDTGEVVEALGLGLARYHLHSALGDAWLARDIYDAAMGNPLQPEPGSTPAPGE